jgi:hypothetical protein
VSVSQTIVAVVSLVATRYGPSVMTGRVSKTLYGSDWADAETASDRMAAVETRVRQTMGEF